MKRLFLSFIVIIIFVTNSQLLAQDSFKSPAAISQVHNQITVGVFPQVELISIVQTISKYPTALGFLMAQDSSKYKTDVINHFQPYKDHPVVLMFDRLSLQPGMLNFSAPSNIMLYTDESLKLRKDIELDDFVISRAGGIDSLKIFLNLLGDYAIQSSFHEFFQEHQDFYLNIVENTISNLGSTNYISEVETFYGKKQKSYNIILVSLYGGNGFGNSLLCSNDQRELYNTMGPVTVKNNVPFFGDENYFKYMIRHEFSHPFINPLTEKNWDYIKDYSSKYDSIPDVARKKVCGDWQECINEFIIRAITTQIALNEAEESGLQAYEKEKSKGVSYLDSLLNKIRYYQSNRETYSTLESYYLHLLDVFKEE
ncbi:MAG: DUF4932 domain-containing protein [Cyclobacteriaceae bacterium]|nr:DUF4932 domain-containing protein [Cyclobacteriaceae bacterium]